MAGPTGPAQFQYPDFVSVASLLRRKKSFLTTKPATFIWNLKCYDIIATSVSIWWNLGVDHKFNWFSESVYLL